APATPFIQTGSSARPAHQGGSHGSRAPATSGPALARSLLSSQPFSSRAGQPDARHPPAPGVSALRGARSGVTGLNFYQISVKLSAASGSPARPLRTEPPRGAGVVVS